MLTPNFDALRNMHESVNDLLHSPITKQRLILHGQEKCAIDEVSEASLKMLDVCGTTKDLLLLVKHHLQDLHSTFRRIIGLNDTSAVGEQLSAYHLHRKNLKKQVLKRLNSLKGIKTKKTKNVCSTSPLTDHNLRVVVNVLKEVRVTTLSIMESLVSLISMPNPNRKPNKEVIFTMRFTCVNSLSVWEKCDQIVIQSVIKSFKAVDIVIENFEVELDSMFRRLIQTRASLLNILTNY